MSDKLRSKKFWLSVAGVIIMVLQLFGVKIDVPYVTEAISSVCAALVLMGLLDSKEATTLDENDNSALPDEKDDLVDDDKDEN